MKLKKELAAAVIAGLCSVLVFAADDERRKGGPEAGAYGENDGDVPPHAIMRVLDSQEMIAKLGLTPDQVETLREKLYELQKQEIQLRARQELAATEQARLMTRPQLDEKAVMKAVEQLGEIRTEMAKLQMQRLILLKTSLTEEQKAKLRAIIRQRRNQQRRQEQGGGEANQQVNRPFQQARREAAAIREQRQKEREALRGATPTPPADATEANTPSTE